MNALTPFDWFWLVVIISICLYALKQAWHDRKESKRELKDAEDFDKTINELKHKDYGKEKETL